METIVTLVLAGIFALAAPVGIPFGYRNYTREQRRTASAWWKLYVAGLACVSVIGAGNFAWVYTGGAQTVWLFTLLPVVLLPVLLVQWKMHAEMGYTGWLDEWFSTRPS